MIAALLAFALLPACSLGGPEPVADGDAVFPHGVDYEQGTVHGPDALRVGKAACDTCHTTSSTAPACASCHPSWPHDATWLANHGAGLDKDHLQPCLDCHAVPGSAAETAATCDRCHASWPHPDGWDVTHGAYTLARGGPLAPCGSCHGSHLEGKAPAPSCTSCHPSWPHPGDWLVAHRDAAKADLASCEQCHGAIGDGPRDGGASGVSCDRCHAGYPHPSDWKTSHLDAAAFGEGPCLACHAPGDGPATMTASCAQTCHGGAP